MTKHEFMTQFTNELHKRHIADAADVAEEYEQHFAFKMADGYSEEKIAAKLGDPFCRRRNSERPALRSKRAAASRLLLPDCVS